MELRALTILDSLQPQLAAHICTTCIPHAHVVTTTTHKSLRGPRSGVILWNEEELTKPLNMAVFPGLLAGLSRAVGVYYPPATFLIMAVGFLFLIVVHFSWEFSRPRV